MSTWGRRRGAHHVGMLDGGAQHALAQLAQVAVGLAVVLHDLHRHLHTLPFACAPRPLPFYPCALLCALDEVRIAVLSPDTGHQSARAHSRQSTRSCSFHVEHSAGLAMPIAGPAEGERAGRRTAVHAPVAAAPQRLPYLQLRQQLLRQAPCRETSAHQWTRADMACTNMACCSKTLPCP